MFRTLLGSRRSSAVPVRRAEQEHAHGDNIFAPRGDVDPAGLRLNPFATSCLHVGPYADLVQHPQRILSLPDADLLGVAGSNDDTSQQTEALAQGLARTGDVELTAAASGGGSVLPQSGAFVTVTWKGIPWLAAPFEYWIGMWLEGEDAVETAPIKFHFIASLPAARALNATAARRKGTGKHDAAHDANAYGFPQREGTVRFYVLNYRKPVIFRLMHGRAPPREELASSAPVTFSNQEGEPANGRIAIAPGEGNASAVTVHWETGRNVSDSQRVQYGLVPSELVHEAYANRRVTYDRPDMCGGVAAAEGFRSPPLHLSAILTGLPIAEGVRGRRIFYRYGSAEDGWSAVASFLAPNEPRTAEVVEGQEVTRMFAFGDLGQHSPDGAFQHCDAPASRRTIDAMRRLVQRSEAAADALPAAHAVLHLGDISYARGYAAEWLAFADQIQPLARSVPYMTCIGNHESNWPGTASVVGFRDSGGECGVAYGANFPTPSRAPVAPHPSDGERREGSSGLADRRQGGPAQQYQQQREKQYHQQREGSSGLADLEPWYSFDEGLVHVVMLSSEHAPQRAWLAQDLAAVRRDRTPWVIVALHRPMYVTGLPYHADGYDYKVAQDLREAYEPLLLQHRVDLVLAGHHHSYQRTCSIANSSCVPPAAPGVPYGGPVHLVVGMGGYQNTPIFLPKKEFVVTDCLHHGFVRLDASRRVLRVEYLVPNTGGARPLSMRDEDCDCDVLDSFSLPVQPGLA